MGISFHLAQLRARCAHGAGRQDSGRYVHDDRLGYVPRAGYAAPGLIIDSDGLRPTGEQTAPLFRRARPSWRRRFLHFGEEVNDGADLAGPAKTPDGRRVLNGGVSGYGFDQTVLRAEQLAAGTSRRPSSSASWPTTSAAPKCAGCGAPTSLVRISTRTSWCWRACRCRRAANPRTTLTFWQRTLGYSYLFDFILRRLDLLYDWFGDHVRTHPAGAGERLACPADRSAGQPAAHQRRARRGGGRVRSRGVGRSRLRREQRRMTQGLLRLRGEERLLAIDSFSALAEHRQATQLYACGT